MKLEDFKVVNDERFIESAKVIINSKGSCHLVNCFYCPFSCSNSTSDSSCDFENIYKTRRIATEYEDDKLVQSAEQFLELVELKKRVDSTTAKSVIEENTYKKFSKAISTVMSPKSFVEKEEEYIILDQNNCICSEVNTLKLAEEFVSLSLQKDSDNTFTIYKKVKVGKAKVNVETEWEE